MNEQMMNDTIDEVLEETVEVKPTLSKGAVAFIAAAATAIVIWGGSKLVKTIKANKAKKLAAAETEVVELSEDEYSEVE